MLIGENDLSRGPNACPLRFPRHRTPTVKHVSYGSRSSMYLTEVENTIFWVGGEGRVPASEALAELPPSGMPASAAAKQSGCFQ